MHAIDNVTDSESSLMKCLLINVPLLRGDSRNPCKVHLCPQYNRRVSQHPSRRSPPSRIKVTFGAIPLLATWNTRTQHQDIPQRLLATRLRAMGLTVMAGRQRVSPWLVWWLPVSQTATNAKTPTLQHLNGVPQAQTMIRPRPSDWTRPRPPKEPGGSL